MTRRYWKYTRIQVIIGIGCLLALAAMAAHGQTAHQPNLLAPVQYAQAGSPPPGGTVVLPPAPPSVSDSFSNILASFSSGMTNCDIIPYGIYAKGLPKHYGGGIGIAYPVNTYVVVATRMDYVNGDFWMPSGNATLQLPIHPFSWLTLTPFTYAGIGVPVSGGTVAGISFSTKPPKNNNGQPTAILGVGLALGLYKGTGAVTKIDLAGDVEQWTGFPGKQYRIGPVFKFGKW